MTLAFYLLLTFLFLLWVIFPMLAVGPENKKTREQVDSEERINALLNSLGELYATRDKRDKNDFTNMEHRLMLELSRLYHAAGLDPKRTMASETDGPPADAEFCHRCSGKREPRFKHCPSCGTGFQAA